MQIFWGLSLYFKVRNSVFSYVVKSFWYALILLRHTWIKTEKKGVVSKTIYHIRQNRVIYLKIKLEMAINAHFCQFSSSASFSSVFFVVVSKNFYHIRQNRVLSLEIKLEMASNPQFFLSVFILCFFLFCVFCVSFYSFFCSATTTYTITATTTTTTTMYKWIYKS